MTTILLLGKNGQVGHELCTSLAGLGNLTAWGRAELDLSDLDTIRSKLSQLRPQLVVNAAAYTAVDDAESHSNEAMLVNRDATRVLAEEAKKLDGALIHYSTDYVFDGAKARPYTEDDDPNPLSVYGATKLAGERAIEASGVAHLILRTSWVYSNRDRNFVTAISGRIRQGAALKVVDDQTGSPTWARTIARTTRLIIDQCRGAIAGMQGIYHLAAAGAATRHGLATKIAELLAGDRESAARASAKVQAVSSSEFPAVAARPRYSVLSTSKLKTRFGIEMAPWDADLEEFFRAHPTA